ncbi:MAG: hypothetical protein ABI559_09715 [Chloroflexota bacterium]
MLKSAIVVAFAVICFALAGCSSGDDNASATPSHTPTPTPLGNGNGSGTSTGGATATSAASATTGSSSTATSGASLTDACSLLTQAEVTSAVGLSVGPGQSLNDGKKCEWDYTDPNDEFSGLSAAIDIDLDQEVFREDQQGGLNTVQVSGVGDEAYFTPAGQTSLFDFRKGTLLFETSLLTSGSVKAQFPSETQEAVEKAMALAALPRIP